MKKLSLLLILASSFMLQAQESTSSSNRKPRVDIVDHICGRLVQSEGTEKENSKGQTVEKNRSLPRVRVDLFKAGDSRDCCEGSSKLDHARTGLSGEFQFKVEPGPGLYWLVFHPGDHTFTISVQYDTTAKQVTKKCSELLYVLEGSGDIHLLRKDGSE
jgi:hypothetical protein